MNIVLGYEKNDTTKLWVVKNSILKIYYYHKDPESKLFKDPSKSKLDLLAKVKNFSIEYEEEKLENSYHGDAICISLSSAIAALTWISKFSGEDVLSSRLDCIISFYSEHCQNNFENALSNVHVSFKQLNVADQINFMTLIYNKESNLGLLNHMKNLGQRGSYETTPINPKAIQRKEKQKIL